MRAITVRQPWAWAIIHGGKDVENRSRNLAGAYRGPVAIHAGIVATWAGFDEVRSLVDPAMYPDPPGTYRRSSWYFGGFIGVVDLVDVHRAEHDASYCNALGRDDASSAGLCSPWAMDDHHHLVLANPRPLAHPIPAKGHLGLWTPDEDVQAAIREQIEVRP